MLGVAKGVVGLAGVKGGRPGVEAEHARFVVSELSGCARSERQSPADLAGLTTSGVDPGLLASQPQQGGTAVASGSAASMSWAASS